MSNINNPDTILAQHSIVVPVIRAWTGTAKLGRDDLSSPDVLPPDHLATAGSIRLVPPASLSFVKSIKGKIWHRIRSMGLPLEGMGTLVKDSLLSEVGMFMSRMHAEWDKSVDDLIVDITSGDTLKNWLADNPEWSGTIRSKLPANLDSLRERFSFRWQVYHVMPGNEEQASGLAEEIRLSAFERLVTELRDMTDKAFSNQTPAKEGLPRRVLSVFETMQDRCSVLSLMNPNAAAFGECLEVMSDMIQSAHADPAKQLMLAHSLLSSMTDINDAQVIAEAVARGNTATRCVGDMLRNELDNMAELERLDAVSTTPETPAETDDPRLYETDWLHPTQETAPVENTAPVETIPTVSVYANDLDALMDMLD